MLHNKVIHKSYGKWLLDFENSKLINTVKFGELFAWCLRDLSKNRDELLLWKYLNMKETV